MAWLISIGEHIRELTARRSQKVISDMLALRIDVATIITRRGRVQLPVDKLTPGMMVLVRSGDAAAVDGTVVSGCAGVDQSSLTGEPALAETCAGGKVYAGSICVDGELVLRAESVGTDTRIGKIIRMLQEAPARETRVEDYAAKVADRLVVPTFLLAGAVYTFARNLSRALSIIIIDFGTGVRVAAPTAFLSFMAHAAQRGVVIKGGRAMEKLAAADTVVFDKTGTLTTAVPMVSDVVCLDQRYTKKSALGLAALLEAGHNHPIASAILAAADNMGVRPNGQGEARLRMGMGVRATVKGRNVAIGSSSLMIEENVDLGKAREAVGQMEAASVSPLYIAVDGSIVAVIGLADAERPESGGDHSAPQIGRSGRVVMLTGDREQAARAVARRSGYNRMAFRGVPAGEIGDSPASAAGGADGGVHWRRRERLTGADAGRGCFHCAGSRNGCGQGSR